LLQITSATEKESQSKQMITNNKITTICIPLLLLVAVTSFAQNRPAPEPAPTIELPEPVIEEEVVEIEETDIEEGALVEELQEENPTKLSEYETEVEVIAGSEPNKLVRWPSKRPVPEGLVILAFEDVTVTETFNFIAETTGKIVIPIKKQGMVNSKITLQNDEPVSRVMALDILFQAFTLNGIAVIEREDMIIIGQQAQIKDHIGEFPVLRAEDDVMNRQDRGTLVIKVFSVEKTAADVIATNINDMFGSADNSLTVYPESNQIVVIGDIALCQQVQILLDQLDHIWRSGELKTFRLRYADASEISNNILELFEESGSSSSSRTQTNRNQNRNRPSTSTSTNTSDVELRLTVNMQQNSVTVQAEQDIMEDIEELINTEWDLPRSTETSKMYVLRYSDPIKIKNLLVEILGGGSTSTASRTGGRTGNQTQRADVTEAMSGVYRFEAYPDKNAILVLSKTEESFTFLDSIIDSLDQPSDVGLPKIVELKHADAVALSEEINALLAAPGVSATIQRPDEGLSGEGFGQSATTTDNESGGQMSFPWQQGGANSDEQSPESSLIAKIRLVPIVRQNALAFVAPPQYMSYVLDLIEEFDRPTRQVMLSATIAAVALTDDLELGLRWGSGVSSSGDNSIGFNGDITGTIGDILSGVFENGGAVFTLGEGNNIGVALDALNQLTNVRIIQQPRTFTSDNQESIFFNGSEVPVRTTSNTTSSGLVEGGFEYRDVGVMLNVRPRITSHGDVDLTINVELSDQTGEGVGENPIFSRRQVRSQVQLHDGQTVLIGGILKESESKIKRKFPFLGDIPIVGGLFTSVDDTTVREELLVFITPVIVDRLEDNSNNYNLEYLERLQEITLPVDDQVKHIQDSEHDFLQERLKNPASDYTNNRE
jgi:type II secretion system protein D